MTDEQERNRNAEILEVKMKCTKLTLKFEFQYDRESPFGMDIKWGNPTSEQIAWMRDFLLEHFNQEIERLR